jgi:hypothetical protein
MKRKPAAREARTDVVGANLRGVGLWEIWREGTVVIRPERGGP